MLSDAEIDSCLPDERLHPVSRMFLDNWLGGDLATSQFLRLFHLPNSDYLSVSECLLKLLGAG